MVCTHNAISVRIMKCAFSPSLGGKGFRKFANLKPEEIWEKIDEKLNQEKDEEAGSDGKSMDR